MWQEVESPLILIEYVSGDGSEERDQTAYSGKFWIYEHAIKAPFYVIWDPFRPQLDVYELIRARYTPVPPTEAGRFRIPPMEVEFGIWEGVYQGCHASWLRAWDLNGHMIPTPEESGALHQQRAVQERQRAEQEHQRAEQERQRAERLAARLRELGVNPDTV
jgi:hypothetical protein